MIRYLLMVLIIGLSSCHPKERVYVKHKDLSPDLEWQKDDPREFIVPIDDISNAYNMSISFRYATGFRHRAMKVIVTEISPEGNERVKEYDLFVRDRDGNYIGDPGYDIWDSEHLVEPGKKYSEKGDYTYILQHNMPVNPVNMAMEIGLILDLAE